MPLERLFRPIVQLAPLVTRRQLLVLLGLGAAAFAISLAVDAPALRAIAQTTGIALIMLVLFAAIFRAALHRLQQRDHRLMAQVFAESDTPCLLCDMRTGLILWANPQASAMGDIVTNAPVSTLLSGLSANPGALATRLQDHARAQGTATHQASNGQDHHSYRITAISDTVALWSIERHDTTDPRDSLPVQIAQFSADGALCYLSPGLRTTWPEGAQDLKSVISTTGPQPGQIGAVSGAQGQTVQRVLRMPATQDQCETLVFLPAPDSRDSTIDPATAEHAALERMPVALAHIGTDGRFSYLNQEARRLLRLREGGNALLSDTLEGLGRPVQEWLSDVASGRLSRATEVLRLHSSDAETYLKVTLTRTETGASSDVVAVINDVTELKSLEAKFTQSQKMQAIGQLAGGVAHDFNNLLTAISGHCDLLLLRHDRSDLDYPDLMQIQQNTNRAAALVRQLLALSRQQTLKFVTLDLQETMNDVIHLLNRLVGEKITLTMRHGEGVAPIRSDKRQFEQVLMNLVVNARDALPMGGEIRIETEATNLPHGLQREQVHLPAGDYTLIRISDDGTGIPQNLLSNIFDPFFTTKRPGEGTGLGLSTVYGIIKQSGGYIFVDSEEGVGTTFTLYFAAQEPVVEAPAKAKQTGLTAPALKTQRALVLLVEDEAPVRSFAARALELQGHRVIEADCGEAALEILSNPEIRPDFFVTDVIMPGLDGPGWVEQVRDRFPDTPVLFMSGYAEDSRVAAQARISNASFLGKPFSLAEFTATVHAQLLRKSEAA